MLNVSFHFSKHVIGIFLLYDSMYSHTHNYQEYVLVFFKVNNQQFYVDQNVIQIAQ